MQPERRSGNVNARKAVLAVIFLWVFIIFCFLIFAIFVDWQ